MSNPSVSQQGLQQLAGSPDRSYSAVLHCILRELFFHLKTYRVELEEHLCHPFGGGNLQLQLEAVGGEVEGGCHFAAFQMDGKEEVAAAPGRLRALVRQQIEVLADKVEPLIRLEGKPFGSEK